MGLPPESVCIFMGNSVRLRISQFSNPKEHIATSKCIHWNYFGDKCQRTKLKMTCKRKILRKFDPDALDPITLHIG